jgi:hypothetical protein
MRKFYKGCLITLGITLGGFIILIYFFTRPTKIDFHSIPFSDSLITKYTDFPEYKIPSYILYSKKGDIIYQAMLIDEGLDRDVIFKTLIRIDSSFLFDNRFPLDSIEKIKLDNHIAYRKIIDNKFSARINVSKEDETKHGRKIRVYSKIHDENATLDLDNGSYEVHYKSIDKEGYFKDLILYDESKNFLYFERNRYFAFQ